MAESLKHQTAKGFVWSGLERYSVNFLRFILGLILARMLSPTDYGLIGMITIFLAISQTIVDSGFSSALVQKKEKTETDYSTAFYFNIIVGLVLYIVLYISAPLIADFFNEQQLVSITRIVGINVFISSLAIVQRAKLIIKIDFKTQAKVNIISVLLSGIIGISMAYKGYGVWSLVIQSISRRSLQTFLLWKFAKWRPSKHFSYSSFIQLFSFGSRILGSGLLNTIFDNVYLLVIGKGFSTSDLGFYTRAKQFSDLPSINFTSIFHRVSYPTLCKVNITSPKKLNEAFRKFVRLASFVTFPFMISLIILAKPLIIVTLTEKWIQSVEFLQIICLSGIWFPISAVNMNIFSVIGNTKIVLKLTIIKKIITVIILAITIPLGIKALLWGQVIMAIINYLITIIQSSKYSKYSLKDQIFDLSILVAYNIPLIITGILCSYIIRDPLTLTIVSIPLMITIHIFTVKLLNVPEWNELETMLISLKKSHRNKSSKEHQN
ncbi:MAG: lipopolysaccharide biosynthesis protein [Bacteroidia bacterium]|nr:lipopolysaccharide biosynthesis protein [Bacteroidia bacterium]